MSRPDLPAACVDVAPDYPAVCACALSAALRALPGLPGLAGDPRTVARNYVLHYVSRVHYAVSR